MPVTEYRARRPGSARGGTAIVVAALGAAVLASSCGTGSYRYVTRAHPTLEYTVSIPNRPVVHLAVKAGTTYFKVPASWHVFTHTDYLVHAGVASLAPDKQFDTAHKYYFVPFDGSARPNLDNVDKQTGAEPSGLAETVVLDDTQRDHFALSTIRNFSVKYDQAVTDAQTNGTSPSVHIVSQNPELTRPGGLHGSEIVYSVQQTDGSSQTIDQVAMVDSATRVLYVFTIGCEAHCYTDNIATIQAIIRSWTVKEAS
jgi:hypothetical protein